MNLLRVFPSRGLGLASAVASVAIGTALSAIVLGVIASALFDALPFAHDKRLATMVAFGGSTPMRRELKASEVRALRSIGWPVLDVGTAERWPQSAKGWAEVYDGSATTHPLVAYVTRNVLEMAGIVLPSSGTAVELPLLAMVTRSYAKVIQVTSGAPRSVKVGEHWVTVVGVLPEGFKSPLPAMSHEHFHGSGDIQMWIVGQPENVEGYYYTPVLVVAKDASLQSMSVEVDRRMHLELPAQKTSVRYQIEPLRSALIWNQRPLFIVLLLMCVALIAMAVVNLVAVMLIRLDDARKAIAIQAVLGAQRWRLWWLHSREVALVTGVAGILGTALAGIAAPLVVRQLPGIPWAPTGDWFLWVGLGVSATIGTIAALVVSVVFVRRWRAGRYLSTTDAGGNARSIRSLSTLSRWTMAAEVILICLVGAPTVALDQALRGIRDDRPFLNRPHAMVVQFVVSERLSARLGGAAPVYERLRRQIQAIAGVRQVGLGSDAPLLNVGDENWLVGASGRGRIHAMGLAADAEFLSGLGVTVKAGRLFDWRDTPDGPRSAILSASLAAKLFGSAGAVGRTIDWHGRREVVAVVGDVRLSRTAGTTAVLYVPLSQEPPRRVAAIVDFESAAEMNAARPRLEALDREQPVGRVLSMDELARVSFEEQRLYAVLANLFAACAIALGVLGLNLVVGYLSRCRRTEIAVKLAVGIGAWRLAVDNTRVYGLRLLWALLTAAPAAFVSVTMLAQAMAPLAIPRIQPCVVTCAVSVMVFAAAAVGHAAVFGRQLNRTGLRAALASE